MNNTLLTPVPAFDKALRHLLMFACTMCFTAAVQGQSEDLYPLKKNLHQHVSALAHDSMGGRRTGSPGMFAAAEYIRTEFIHSGISFLQSNEPYLDSFLVQIQGEQLAGLNVVGCLPGSSLPQEIIVFSAHYDHFGQQENRRRGDHIFNGANDNASGVAALLELARAYRQDKIPPARTILFIAYSGLHQGMTGSVHFASQISVKKNVIVNINLEMLGSLNRDGVFVSGDMYSQLRHVLNQNLDSMGITKNKDFFLTDGGRYFSSSDNYPLALLGIPAHSLLGGEGQYFHTVHDETDTIDYEEFARTVNTIITACRPLLYGYYFTSRYKPR